MFTQISALPEKGFQAISQIPTRQRLNEVVKTGVPGFIDRGREIKNILYKTRFFVFLNSKFLYYFFMANNVNLPPQIQCGVASPNFVQREESSQVHNPALAQFLMMQPQAAAASVVPAHIYTSLQEAHQKVLTHNAVLVEEVRRLRIDNQNLVKQLVATQRMLTDVQNRLDVAEALNLGPFQIEPEGLTDPPLLL